MTHKLLGIAIAAIFTISVPQSVDAGHRGSVRISPRTINSFQRDVRQFQRQAPRSLNQFDRSFNRGFRGAPVRFAPRSSGVFLGGQRGGVYLRF